MSLNTFSRIVSKFQSAAARPEFVSFAEGVPSYTCYPLDLIKDHSNNIFSDASLSIPALSYGNPQGYGPLLDTLLVKHSDTAIPNAQCLATSGAQEGLDLVSKLLLLNRSKTVMVENPTYMGALAAMSEYGPQIVGFDVSKDLDFHALDQYLNIHKPAFLYLIPDFQNPSGYCYTLEQRLQLAQILRKHNTILVEDNPYGEINFSGDQLPSMHTIYENTIYLGTFSKILPPGLRVGYVLANQDCINALKVLKLKSSVNSPVFNQMLVSNLINDSRFDSFFANNLDVYSTRMQTMQTAIANYFPESVEVNDVNGGFFIWCRLPDQINTDVLFEKALNHGVAFIPGHVFFASQTPATNYMRLNFVSPDCANIEKGIKILGDLIKSELDEVLD